MIRKLMFNAIVLLFLTVTVNAQIKEETINIFEKGKEVESIEDNFENLSRNIPKIIENSDDIKFLGQEYIGTVHNKQDAKNFLAKRYQKDSTITFVIQEERDKYNQLKSRQVSVRVIHIVKPAIGVSAGRGLLQKQRESVLLDKVAKHIKVGDKVYRLHFSLFNRKMWYSVFVDPQTKQVETTKYNIFTHIPIPFPSH